MLEITSSERKFYVIFDSLKSTPILREDAVCSVFLRDWISIQKKKKIKDVSITISTRGKKKAEDFLPQLYGFSKTGIERDCISLGYCSSSLRESLSLNKELKRCLPSKSISSLLQRQKPRTKFPKISPIESLELEIFPFTTMEKKILRYKDNSYSLLTSTMSLGSTLSKRLAKSYYSSDSSLFISLDAGMLFSYHQAPLLIRDFMNHPNVFVVPMTSGRTHRSVYHWKMILGERGAESTLSAMNLSTPEKAPYLEFLYTFDDPEITQELRGHLINAMKDQCEAIEANECFSDFFYSDSKLSSSYKALVSQGCQKVSELREARLKKKFFIQPQDTDIPYFIESLIEKAKEEIIVLTHKFSSPGVMKALIKAQKKGVEVYLLTAEKPRMNRKSIIDPYYNFEDSNSKRAIPFPHMKTMLIDRKKLFFGTGNFTFNALRRARELFAITNDELAVKKVLEISNSYLYAKNKNKLKDFNATSERHWVALLSKDTRNTLLNAEQLADTFEILSDTSTVVAQSPKSLRLVNLDQKDKLKECDLESLMFITELDYISCISKK